MESSNEAPSRQATGAERVLVVLKELAVHPDGVTLDALARAVGAPKSTVHRALGVLGRSSLAQQTSRGHYVLGTEFVRLAFAHHEGRQETQLVTPCLEELAATLGEAAHYASLDGAEVIYRAKVRPSEGIQMTSIVGGRNPAFCTGVGKALMSATIGPQTSAAELETRFGPFERRTPNTLVDSEAMLADLRRSAERGYALDDEENEPTVNCIAFPIYLASPSVPTGAISVSALTHRIQLPELERRSGEIRAIIERHLGAVTR